MNHSNNGFDQYFCSFSSKCGSISDTRIEDIKKGGKIVMPSSALEKLTRLNISYPMLFKLTNENSSKFTHCGVLEFLTDDGVACIPKWMMNNLLLNEGEELHVQSCSLPIATYAKFQPQSIDFLDISNPKAVLENALRNYACLTKGDIIAIQYNGVQYELLVQDVKPGCAVCIIECDLDLEFQAPVGYQPPDLPEKKHPQAKSISTELQIKVEEYMKEHASFTAFQGLGKRLVGKKMNGDGNDQEFDIRSIQRGLPNEKWSFGWIDYIRNNEPLLKVDKDNKFEAFTGKGENLRRRKKSKK